MATKVVVTERNQQYSERLKKLLEADDIFHPVSPDIKLKDDGERWHLLWVNAEISDMQYQEHKDIGYIPVEPADLATPVAEFGAQVSAENKVTRGPREKEILMKAPIWYNQQRQQKKAQKNVELTYGEKAKRDLVNAVGSELGDHAASFATRMTIKDSRRPYELPDE